MSGVARRTTGNGTAPLTGRGDTLLAFGALLTAVAFVATSAVVVLVAHHRIGQARRQLPRTLFSVARELHRRPDDPAVLPLVAARLPGHVHLVPARTFRTSHRVLLDYRKALGGRVTRCIILPTEVGGRISRCPRG